MSIRVIEDKKLALLPIVILVLYIDITTGTSPRNMKTEVKGEHACGDPAVFW